MIGRTPLVEQPPRLDSPRLPGFLTAIFVLIFAALATGRPSAAGTETAAIGYREPSAAVVRLLTAPRPPEPLLHTRSGRVALLYRASMVPIEQLARPFLGLAGYRFDPATSTSTTQPWIERVEVVRIGEDRGTRRAVWTPAGGAQLEYIQFSPDGNFLSALAVSGDGASLVLFDISREQERVLPTPVNAAFGNPCSWIEPDTLLCRLVPKDRGKPPAPRISPDILEHPGGPAPARTYGNLLEDPHEEELFEYYFSSDLALVALEGTVRRLTGSTGLLARVQPSPSGALALVVRLQRPYSRLLPASRFPRKVEIWDLHAGRSIDAPGLPPDRSPRGLRTFAWKSGTTATLGWSESPERIAGNDDRWLALDPPFSEPPRQVVRIDKRINGFGWTTAGTAYFTTRTERGTRMQAYLVRDGQPRRIWSGATQDRYGNPGRALRADGEHGRVLEIDGRIFLASDGIGPDGPEPYLESLHLETLETERLFTSPTGVYERVLGILEPSTILLLTTRESESEPPNLYAMQGQKRTRLRPIGNPYPELDGVERRVVEYPREDGVLLHATLYLPPGHRIERRLPTLVWIYPTEFSDPEYAEQMQERRFRFHHVRGPSPLAVLLAGYALLLHPTMPIIGEAGAANDAYLPQLISNAEAAVDFLVSGGVADPDRIAIAGHSYGAFSSANLLAHTSLFQTGIALSGAYNRTLTPFGFQREKRSFWEAADLYARISPFFHADQIDEPLLLIHGAADANAGTPPKQARRFFGALVGNGVPVRYVELPHEGHHLRARESILHVAAEMIDWLDRTIGKGADHP
jgi:dipeptidyl aminopeptidase/acylaminoacyl peptidase